MAYIKDVIIARGVKFHITAAVYYDTTALRMTQGVLLALSGLQNYRRDHCEEVDGLFATSQLATQSAKLKSLRLGMA